MCDMYGHAYWDGKEIIADFLRCNSHRELDRPVEPPGQLVMNRDDFLRRFDGSLLANDVRRIETGRFDEQREVVEAVLGMLGCRDIQVFLFAPEAMGDFWDFRVRAWSAGLPKPVTACGLDPTNAKVIFHHNEEPKDADIATQVLVAKWNQAFPSTSALEPWIEAHFGKRGDEVDWQDRGPLLLDPSVYPKLHKNATVSLSGGRGVYGISPRMARVSVQSASELIDHLRVSPSPFWARTPEQVERIRREADAVLAKDH